MRSTTLYNQLNKIFIQSNAALLMHAPASKIDDLGSILKSKNVDNQQKY